MQKSPLFASLKILPNWPLFLLFLSPHVLSLDFDEEIPERIQSQITADLEFVNTLEGPRESPLHVKIFGKLTGENYQEFFNSRIDQVGLDDCGSSYAIACIKHSFFDSQTSKMWITPNYARYGHPQMARLMVLFHEARHTESENYHWSHAPCPDPFNDHSGLPIKSIWTGNKLAGRLGCDRTPIGSYGISIILLKNIAKFCSNCTEKVRMDAELYGDDQVQRIIDSDAKEEIHSDINQT